MTIVQFKLLNHDEKANAIWSGVYLETRAELKYNILLYAVSDFYVEVFYSSKLNEIVKFKAFKDNKNLQIYLNQLYINIDGIQT